MIEITKAHREWELTTDEHNLVCTGDAEPRPQASTMATINGRLESIVENDEDD